MKQRLFHISMNLYVLETLYILSMNLSVCKYLNLISIIILLFPNLLKISVFSAILINKSNSLFYKSHLKFKKCIRRMKCIKLFWIEQNCNQLFLTDLWYTICICFIYIPLIRIQIQHALFKVSIVYSIDKSFKFYWAFKLLYHTIKFKKSTDKRIV